MYAGSGTRRAQKQQKQETSMFTILYKGASGRQQVLSAKSVIYYPAPQPEVRVFSADEDTYTSFDDGEVYVMNDAGRTVSFFNLGTPPDISEKGVDAGVENA